MLKGAVSKVMWVGRTAVSLVGLAVILALAFAAASMVLGVNGGRSLPGDYNQINPITQLAGSDVGANQVLNVDPMAMRRQIEVPRGYAQVNVTPTAVTTSGAKGINGVQRSTTDNSVYCFDLKFAPKAAVARPTSTTTPRSGRGWETPCPPAARRGSRMRRPGRSAQTTQSPIATSTSASCLFSTDLCRAPAREPARLTNGRITQLGDPSTRIPLLRYQLMWRGEECAFLHQRAAVAG